MILCLGTTPAAQRVMLFEKLRVDEVNRATLTADGAAGKAVNLAKVLHALGAEAVVTGFVGGARGAELQHHLHAEGVPTQFVEVSSPTRQCVTVLDESLGTVTELVEESHPVEAGAYESLLSIVQQHLSRGCQAVVMSGTIASGGPPNLYARCTRLAHDAGAMAAVDGSGAALMEALQVGPDLVKPNRAELAATVNRALLDEGAVVQAMRELHAQGTRRIVVTAGAEPALAFDGALWWRVTSPKVAALNPIGSGDAFAAALVWRLAIGEDLGTACRWAAAAGAANALTLMAGEVRRDDVLRLLPEVKLEEMRP